MSGNRFNAKLLIRLIEAGSFFAAVGIMFWLIRTFG